MKRFLLILVIALGVFTSCQKEYLTPIQEEVLVEETIPLDGTWLLVGGKMYLENLETGEKTVYNHFDANKTVSSLRYEGVMFEFERIVLDSTTWSFILPSDINYTGEFWLDMDSLQPYGLYVTSTNYTIIEHPTANTPSEMQLGGSSRPLTAFIDDYNQKTVNFYVQEAYTNINGYNYKYFSELTFQKQ